MRGNWEFSSFARSCDGREEQFGAVGASCPAAAAAALVLTGLTVPATVSLCRRGNHEGRSREQAVLLCCPRPPVREALHHHSFIDDEIETKSVLVVAQETTTKHSGLGTSLVVQWLTICLSVQGI